MSSYERAKCAACGHQRICHYEGGGRVGLSPCHEGGPRAECSCHMFAEDTSATKPKPLVAPMRLPVLYLAHPVAGDVAANLARAKRWLLWARRAFATCAVIAPWITDLDMGDDDCDPAQREQALLRDEAVARACDAVMLVGGCVTDGMRREATVAKRLIDLTVLGEEPPQ